PYLVATQAHPELRSRPTRPHPLFAGLVKASVDRLTAHHRLEAQSTCPPRGDGERSLRHP
ncbi:hypothetical protein ACFY1U_48000, partial [Streptomyces sp. NPDC001351]|uniref:hypothetical protein n=1 Tax=Streptomyces sp. NPDC001351 TaxID=3364564 RepID=UPI0036CB880F